jgi:hypothetical protein
LESKRKQKEEEEEEEEKEKEGTSSFEINRGRVGVGGVWTYSEVAEVHNSPGSSSVASKNGEY